MLRRPACAGWKKCSAEVGTATGQSNNTKRSHKGFKADRASVRPGISATRFGSRHPAVAGAFTPCPAIKGWRVPRSGRERSS